MADRFEERLRSILPRLADGPINSINDAIEAYQTKLTVEGVPEFFGDAELSKLREEASKAFANACRYVNAMLQDKGIFELYSDLEQQYVEQFWKLLGSCGAEKSVNGQELGSLLKSHPRSLGYVLELPGFVRDFDTDIRDAMVNTARASAELIIGRMAMASPKNRRIILPKSLSNDDIDEIMLAYLGGEHPNPNYVEVLTRWPDGRVDRYSPSADVRVGAKRVYKSGMQELFADGAGIRSSIGVAIDPDQKACRGIKIGGLNIDYIFGGKWLETYMDSATIMNNCRYLFDFLDGRGLLQMSAHAHEESGFTSILGPRVIGEYRSNPIARNRSYTAILETRAYADFLEKHDISLESALEWVYKTYFTEEYGIEGFYISLPARNGTWLDRCKGMGPEIERAMKGYQLYVERGRIDGGYLGYETFKSFADVPSLSEQKYAVAAEGFDKWACPLFSDQSLLAFAKGKGADDRSFFDLILSTDVTRDDYDEFLRPEIDQLGKDGLLYENPTTGVLSPTEAACCLKLVWDSGAVPLERCRDKAWAVIEDLISRDVLKYHSGLFTPDEASYLNYMLNDSEQTNAIGLRNKYSHASGPISDPNAKEIRSDYYTILALLVSITLKINDELARSTGKGHIEDFVDWPFYDESVYQTAQELVGSAN